VNFPGPDPTTWDFEMYDSEDVGDTETVGYFCRGCIATWEREPGKQGVEVAFPFIPASA
jgi:hypothetical protein